MYLKCPRFTWTHNFVRDKEHDIAITAGKRCFITGQGLLRKHKMGIFTGESIYRKSDLQEETARHILFECKHLEQETTWSWWMIMMIIIFKDLQSFDNGLCNLLWQPCQEDSKVCRVNGFSESWLHGSTSIGSTISLHGCLTCSRIRLRKLKKNQKNLLKIKLILNLFILFFLIIIH